jgi:hypothetical protein
MPGTHDPRDDIELPSSQPDDRDDPESAYEADDREHRVVHRPNPLPAREEDEEELAEADLLHELDLDEDNLDEDDLDHPDR